MVVAERIGLLVPRHLSADGVGDGRDELAAQAQLAADLARKLLRGVVLLGQVPLELQGVDSIEKNELEFWLEKPLWC